MMRHRYEDSEGSAFDDEEDDSEAEAPRKLIYMPYNGNLKC